MEVERAQLMEAALDLMEEGVAVVDAAGMVVFWNHAAAEIAGYERGEMQARRLPESLYRVDVAHRQRAEQAQTIAEQVGAGFGGAVAGYTTAIRTGGTDPQEAELLERPTLVQMKHRKGHTFPVMLRRVALCNGLGVRMGSALLFHAVEDLDALPHGETLGGIGVKRSQAEMEDRLDEAHHRWVLTRMPYGLIWITVDQAVSLRRTHGREACEEMLGIVEQTLLHGLRPTETLGRWGDEEFLVLAHERSLALLAEHAHRLAGLARTAEFRWWGDRVTLTVSVGVTQTVDGVTLRSMLQAAQEAMQESSAAGGNMVVTKTRVATTGATPAEPAQPAESAAEPPAILRVRTY